MNVLNSPPPADVHPASGYEQWGQQPMTKSSERQNQRATSVRTCDFVRTLRNLVHKLSIESGSPIGPAPLVAASIVVGPPEAISPILAEHGVLDAEALRRRLRSFSQADVDAPAVRMDTALARRMRDFLAGVQQGDAAATLDMLRSLLQDRDEETLWLLRDPDEFFRCYCGRCTRPDAPGEMLKHLARYYSRAYAIGRWFCGEENRRNGVCRYACHEDSDALAATPEYTRDLRRSAFAEVFSRPIYTKSPLGVCWRRYGELAAHIVGIVLMADLGLLANRHVSMREVAWTISVKYFHRYLHAVRTTVEEKLRPRWVAMPPFMRCQSYSTPVLPSNYLARSFSAYLNMEPITSDEIADAIGLLD